MDGKQLKQIVEKSGIRTNAFAERLGILPQSLNSIFNSADVKSGTLEKVADVLGVPVCTLYGDNNVINNQVNDHIGGDNIVSFGGYDALKKRDEQIDRLLSIIEKMQER